MRRPRGPGGRFLTAAEIAAMDQREKSAGGHEAELSNGSSDNGGYDAGEYQVQHHRQQLKQEEQQQQQQAYQQRQS